MDPGDPLHPALAAARAHAPRWPQGLTVLLDDPGTPPPLRASAIEALTRAHPRHLLARFMDLIADADAGVRLATVRASSILVPEDRVKVAGPALTDPDPQVRRAAGRVLVGAEEELPAERAPDFVTARNEWIESRRSDTGSADAWSELAALYAELGRGDDAERSLRRALELDPDRAGDWANLADLLEAIGRPEEAAEALARGLAQVPDSPVLIHARGLAHIRGGRMTAAREDLRRATKLAPESARFSYVQAVALMDFAGEAAEEVLDAALGRHPRDPELLGLVVAVAEGRGDRATALAAAETLEESDPGNPEYQALVVRLRMGAAGP